MSVVGSEAGMDARRVDADSSGAMDGVARLSERPLRGVELVTSTLTRKMSPGRTGRIQRKLSMPGEPTAADQSALATTE